MKIVKYFSILRYNRTDYFREKNVGNVSIYTILSGKKYVQTRDFFDFMVNTPLEYRRFFRKNTSQKQPRKPDVCRTYPIISPF